MNVTRRLWNDEPELTREQAMDVFRELVRQYGLQWTAEVPREAYQHLKRVNRVLGEKDRREALGLRT